MGNTICDWELHLSNFQIRKEKKGEVLLIRIQRSACEIA